MMFTSLYKRKTGKTLRRKILALRQLGDIGAATALVRQALTDTPDDIGLLKELANLRARAGDDEGIVAALESVRAIEPLGPHTAQLYDRAALSVAKRQIEALHRQGRDREAIARIEAGLERFPEDVCLLKSLAVSCAALDDPEGVLSALGRVRAIEPLGPHTGMLYARADLSVTKRQIAELHRQGQDREAIAQIEAGLERFPDDPDLLRHLAVSRAALADHAGAIAALERMHETVRGAPPGSGAIREQRPRDTGPIGQIEALLETSPDDCGLLRKLAGLKGKAKDYDGAMQALDRVRQIGDFGPGAAAFYDRMQLLKTRTEQQPVHHYIDIEGPERMPLEAMLAQLSRHDVISFDIFDTAIVRAVSAPDHVFRLMGARLGVTDFVKKRKAAEASARSAKDRSSGTREVTLDEIYEVFAAQAGASAEWQQLEQRLEIQLTRKNPYIFEVYERLKAMGKRLIFTSDMYLPMDTIRQMLARAGYEGYDRIYLSNEHRARKGDGSLQRIVLAEQAQNGSVIHVGDVHSADVERSLEAGMNALHNPDPHRFIREKDMGNLAGSFYEAVIDNAMGTGMWDRDLHYSHGFRVGGILVLGYVEFIERLAREKGVDKILFLGRDGDILSKAYRKFCATIPSDYVGVSRAAALMLTTDCNFDDFLGRTFFRWYRESNNTRPIVQLLHETGFGYLAGHLEDADIEPLQFPASADEQRLRDFFWSKKDVIEDHLAGTRAAARDYFGQALGDARSVLLVDIGWTGTCIATLRDFFRSAFGMPAGAVFGALLATSRNQQITDAVSDGSISSYIYSPLKNLDVARLMMPGGQLGQDKRDLLTLPVEYLFTEACASTIGYGYDADGRAGPLRGQNCPPNAGQIEAMQQGVMDFIGTYLEYSAGLSELRRIGPYVAFQPLRNTLGHRPYLYAVYKDFLYDAVPVIHGKATTHGRFGALFDISAVRAAATALGENGTGVPAPARNRPVILFVSPEMIYAGAPHSLLRLCKIAASLGYGVMVWTAKAGPFMTEFEAAGFAVSVVPASGLDAGRIRDLEHDNVRLVVCNTVVTDRYVQALEGRIPLVWYVREATNIAQFLRGNPAREQTLRTSSAVTVVSDYAAAALGEFVDAPVEVVKNAVADTSALGLPYRPAKDGIVRFVQLGTIEHRKGYDIFVAAYKAMPSTYRARAELHFAGGFINSGTSFASYLFGQMAEESAIRYHGLIADEREKTELLSQMDVVVVASRDESCSLVALEGAMLSKPLIVTENVGAKYMVEERNGLVVRPGDVMALRTAFMQMIDRQGPALEAMGRASRQIYDERASLDTHRRELGSLFARRIAAGPLAPRPDVPAKPVAPEASSGAAQEQRRETIVSLTSFPPRMATIAGCIGSLKQQSMAADRILLWLSEEQFPNRMQDLPEALRSLEDERFSIRWVRGDIGPHKKYFYAMQEFPDAVVVTVDDDVAYDRDLLRCLHEAHLAHPDTIVAGRANLVRFRPDGGVRTYDQWAYDYQHLRETETYALLPTGVGGVLYPAGAIPSEAFDADLIAELCPHADDLWLKAMATANGYPVSMPRKRFSYPNIDGSQTAALWRGNSFRNGNDLALGKILAGLEAAYGIATPILHRIWGVRPDGSFVGPGDTPDREPLWPDATRERAGECLRRSG